MCILMGNEIKIAIYLINASAMQKQWYKHEMIKIRINK